MQSNLVSPEPASRHRVDLDKRVIQGCDFTVSDEICNNLVVLARCPILHDIPESENAVFVNHGIWDIQMLKQFLEYNGRREKIACPRTNVSLRRSKFETKSRLSAGEATTLIQQCAGHPITERQARSFLERLMSPRTLRDTVSASRFVRGALGLKSEIQEKVSDYENFVRRKERAARSNVPESSRRASRVTLGSSDNYHTSRVSPTKVREEFRHGTELHLRHSAPATVSPDHSLGHSSHLSHRTPNRSSAESSLLFPTSLSPDNSSALSQQNSVYRHSRRRYQSRVVSPDTMLRQRQLSSFVADSPPSRQIPPILSTATSQQGVSSARVYIAASRKGKCYHSHETCSGLRSAFGVTSVSLEHASNMLGMRPCKVCRPQSMSSQRPERLLQSITPPSFSYSPEVSARSSSLYAAQTYWITRTGQCYHSSRSCSSLRRSKVVTPSNGKPVGKRPCRLCC